MKKTSFFKCNSVNVNVHICIIQCYNNSTLISKNALLGFMETDVRNNVDIVLIWCSATTWMGHVWVDVNRATREITACKVWKSDDNLINRWFIYNLQQFYWLIIFLIDWWEEIKEVRSITFITFTMTYYPQNLQYRYTLYVYVVIISRRVQHILTKWYLRWYVTTWSMLSLSIIWYWLWFILYELFCYF